MDKIFSEYTEVDGEGFWRDDAGVNYREASKLIIYVHDNSTKETGKIDSVIEIYKARFEQRSVMQVDKEVVRKF